MTTATALAVGLKPTLNNSVARFVAETLTATSERIQWLQKQQGNIRHLKPLIDGAMAQIETMGGLQTAEARPLILFSEAVDRFCNWRCGVPHINFIRGAFTLAQQRQQDLSMA